MNIHRVRNGVLLAGAIIVAALALKTGQRMHYYDQDAANRAFEVLMGLCVAFYGNYIPKMISPEQAGGRMRIALRISGWCFMLAGLAYAALSLLSAPGGDQIAMAAIAGAVVVTAIVGVWACQKPRAAVSN
jgi:multisubunit Na+/H+ antiporter MnhB subunit